MKADAGHVEFSALCQDLLDIVLACRLVAEDDPWAEDPEFLIEVVVSKYERRKSQRDTVNAMPLYPTEAILWDENQVPKVHYTGEPCAFEVAVCRLPLPYGMC